MLEPHEVDNLFPADLPETGEWEQRYPPRDLPADAQVTRLAPSPTGFIHLGGIYTAMIDLSVAHETGGRYFVRIEDTDQSREVAGAYEQFDRAFAYFRVIPDEGVGAGGEYGPYRQSERATIYLSYAREMLRSGKAYLCFATSDELTEIRTRQQQLKRPTGYYGEWAIWRDADDAAVREQLEQGDALRGALPLAGPHRRTGVVHRRDPWRIVHGGQLQRRGHPEIVCGRATSDLSLRACRRRSLDAVQPGDPRRGVVVVDSVTSAIVRGAGFPAADLCAYRAADEADPGRQAQAVQAQGPRSRRRLLHQLGLSRRRGAVLLARSGQRAAGRDPAARSSGRADLAGRVRRCRPAGGSGEAGGHQRRPRRDAERAGDLCRADGVVRGI